MNKIDKEKESPEQIDDQVRLPKWIMDWLDTQSKTKSALITEAVISKYNLQNEEKNIS